MGLPTLFQTRARGPVVDQVFEAQGAKVCRRSVAPAGRHAGSRRSCDSEISLCAGRCSARPRGLWQVGLKTPPATLRTSWGEDGASAALLLLRC
jgi:hypothetical protein